MNGAYPRRQLDGVRTTVDNESDDMDLDSGDDTDSADYSKGIMECQETLGANLGEDLHLQWLQSLAQPRNISAIGIAEDGMLLDRMLRNRNISDRHLQHSSQGDRYTINSNLQDEMNECYDIRNERLRDGTNCKLHSSRGNREKGECDTYSIAGKGNTKRYRCFGDRHNA